MGEKSAQKKKYILEKAKEVFIEKGFRSVTMKDIVEACEISRGGLYLYFSGTEEIFEEVLAMEAEEADDVFSAGVGENAAAAEIMALFLKEQKREILRSKKTLTAATYEYVFANPKNNILKKQFAAAVAMLDKLIQMGIQNKEFYDVDTRIAAKNIMYVLEGLKIASLTIGVSSETIDNELYMIMQGLVAED